MKLSRTGIKLIIDFEGKHKKLPDGRYAAYLCPANVWTVYTGITEGVHEGMIVTEAEGMAMFRKEIAMFEEAVNNLVKVGISQNQRDALISFAFNCGSGALKKSTLLKKVNKCDFNGAAAEFHKWNKGGGKVLPGLVRRRAQEAELFLTPDASNEPAMPQAVDVPAPVAVQVKETARQSRTVLGTLLGIFGAVLAATKEFVAEAASQIGLLAPLREILSGIGMTGTKIALAVTIAGCLYALYAKFDDTIKGLVLK